MMLENLSAATQSILHEARSEALRLNCDNVTSEHLLLAMTKDGDNVASAALASMSVTSESLRNEVENSLLKTGQMHPKPPAVPGAPPRTVEFTGNVRVLLHHADDYRRYLGQKEIQPEHVLLAMIDTADEPSVRILEEVGANLTFLERQVMNAAARRDALRETTAGIRQSIVQGVNELVVEHAAPVDDLKLLALKAGTRSQRFPERVEIVHLIVVSYLPQFLKVQVAFQRYLLEETLRLINRRAGNLDKELTATIVSTAAQNLRSEVREAIEEIWSHELRLFSQMPDEAEHDLIGSVIEDLWWTHSEEIAVHEVFDEALDDYRRKHVLNLQKRRLEISERLTSLHSRLDDTVRQCLIKGPLSV